MRNRESRQILTKREREKKRERERERKRERDKESKQEKGEKQQRRKGVRRYSVFHRFRPAKFGKGGSILRWSQFLLLFKLPRKMKLTRKWLKLTQK